MAERLPEILGLLEALAQKRSGLEYLETVLRYVARGADKLKPADLRQAVTQALTGGEQLMSTIAEQWIQQGYQQGLQQGLQQGVAQGLAAERQLLLRLIRRRFGAEIAEQSTALLEQVSEPEVLEELGERLLDCTEGEGWLQALRAKVEVLEKARNEGRSRNKAL